MQAVLRSSSLKSDTLSSLCSLITDGDHGVADYQEEGVAFILSENVKEGWIDTKKLRKISRKHHSKLAKSSLKKGDVLVTKTGVYFGKSATVDETLGEANTIAHVGILRPKSTITPLYLSTFLNSAYGQSQLRRRGIKATRPEIKLIEFHDIEVPLASDFFQNRIERIWQRAQKVRSEIDAAMLKAENTLLEALGLTDWRPTETLSYTTRSSETFTAGRWDSQYYRPLFSEVEQRLSSTGRAVLLGDILDINSRGRQPVYSDDGLPVINSKHVRANKVLLDDGNRNAVKAGSPVVIEKGDVLVNGTGVGTIGRAAAYLHEQRALPDNHVTVLRTTGVDPIYLAVFLNSLLGQLQIERHIRGSSGQIELYPSDIAKVVFWNAPQNVQTCIRDAVLSAFDQELRSQDLLEASKQSIEIAIEEGESAASAFLDALEEEG